MKHAQHQRFKIIAEFEFEISQQINRFEQHTAVGQPFPLVVPGNDILKIAHCARLTDIGVFAHHFLLEIVQERERLLVFGVFEVGVQYLGGIVVKLFAVPDDAALILGQPREQELEALFVRIRILHQFIALVDRAAHILAAYNVVEAQDHGAGILDHIHVRHHTSRKRVDQLLPLDGKGTVLPHVVRIVAVLLIGNADDHHAFFGVHEKTALPARPDQILLLRVELHKGDFFNTRVGPVLSIVPDGCDRPVGLPEHAHQEPLAELVQTPGKKRRRGPAFRGNGKTIQFH